MQMHTKRVCYVLPLLLASSGAAWAADTELRIYGGIDVSIDQTNTGLQNITQASTNNSYVGFGATSTLTPDWTVVGQIEGAAAITATPNLSDTFGFRNSFIGFVSKTWGSIKVGKNDTPYKSSTAAFDPFANTIGDYNSIVSNTGGDSRVEFENRAPHAVWYESPTLFGALNFNVMWGFGQNRAGDNTDFPLGDNTCSGGNFGSSGSGNAGVQNNFGSLGINLPPGVTLNQPHNNNGGAASNLLGTSTIGSGFGECTDGGFGNLYSASLIYKRSNFIAIAAAELHHAVNRTSDVVPIDGVPADVGLAVFSPTPNVFSTGQVVSGLVTTRTEYAIKFGGGYDFGPVKVYALYEMLRRTNTPDAFNERSRDGVFASATWRVTPSDDLSVSYNHAFATPGNPLINSTLNFTSATPANGIVCPLTPTPTTSAPNNNDDAADEYAIGLRHYFNPAVSVYLVGAMIHNHPCGHFTLGAGGHGIPVTQRNQFNETFVGKDLSGISVGTTFRF